MRARRAVSFLGGLLLGALLSSPRSCPFGPPTPPLDLGPGEELLGQSESDPPVVLPVDSDPRQSLLFVGVMTARKYLSTRAVAVHETWGRRLPGKIAFFSSEESLPSDAPGLPLVRLRGVDDSYPPQKKSFLMLQYVWENYGRHFEWFLRADDDVYVRPDKMEAFLRSIDSRKPFFIGQAGRGNQEEFGLLSLEYDENFCMGGPGVIMSRETLSRVAPHIKHCLKNLYTTHEDVELGRCVQKFAGIPCTWSYEMQTILYHNSSGKDAFTGNLKQKEVHRAITLHPVKQYKHLYRIYNYMQVLKIQELLQDSLHLHRDILAMAKLLNNSHKEDDRKVFPPSQDHLGDSVLLGQPPGLMKFKPKKEEEIIPWEFIQRSAFSAADSNPRRRVESSLKEGLEDVVREVMELINMYSKQRGRVIDFKEIWYGYFRFNPLYGADYILDMLLTYKKYRGRKMTVPVRRHAYLQQQFSEVEIREVTDGKEVFTPVSEGGTEYESETPNGFKESVENGLLKIGKSFPFVFLSTDTEAASNSPVLEKIVNFILPLAGRFETFQRFMTNFEQECLWTAEKVTLIVILFQNDEDNSIAKTMNLIKHLQLKYDEGIISVVPVFEIFSRAKALEIGSTKVNAPDDLLFFIDVDIVFQRGVLQRIRSNTIKGKQVYFPIVFSEFDQKGLNLSGNSNHFAINDYNGFWRQYGFGIASIYKSDLTKVGGFNTSISGWGKEDVDLFDKFIATAKNITIFRSADPVLVHVFHVVECSEHLEDIRMKMCRGTRADTYGSVEQLAGFVNKLKEDNYSRISSRTISKHSFS